MALTYDGDVACFADTVGIEEAEGFLAWIQNGAEPRVNMLACTHIHAALLQILMAARTPVAVWPELESLNQWLTSALS